MSTQTKVEDEVIIRSCYPIEPTVFKILLRVIVTMKNIEIISHILFELTLATRISETKICKVNPILKFKLEIF